MKDVQLHGECLCRAVRYQINGAVKHVSCCHCSQCRKQTGLYYATVEMHESVIAIEGQEHLSQYRASESATRQFCQTCGSALFWQADGSEQIFVLAGSLETPTGLLTRKHIYCADKADFYELPADGVKFSHDGDV